MMMNIQICLHKTVKLYVEWGAIKCLVNYISCYTFYSIDIRMDQDCL